MKINYEESLRRVLASEGGYTNHPSDPGGPTNFGITIGDYRHYVNPSATAADVRAMKVDEAKTIYRARYWDAQRCDELPSGVDYAIFDYGVNSGIGRSGKVLRRCLKLTDQSSVVTDAVIAAATTANAKDLISAICDERLRFLKSLKTWPVFGAGWGERVGMVRKAASVMATRPDLPPITIPQAQGKGVVPVNENGQRTSASGVIVGGAATIHATNYDPLIAGMMIIVCVILGIAVWAYWHHRQQQQQEAAA